MLDLDKIYTPAELLEYADTVTLQEMNDLANKYVSRDVYDRISNQLQKLKYVAIISVLQEEKIKRDELNAAGTQTQA